MTPVPWRPWTSWGLFDARCILFPRTRMSVTGRGAPVSSRETLTTGRSLQQRWRWSVRSGRRIRTSSGLGCRLGPRTGCCSISGRPTRTADGLGSPQIVRKKSSRDRNQPTTPNHLATAFVQVRRRFQAGQSMTIDSTIPAATFRFKPDRGEARESSKGRPHGWAPFLGVSVPAKLARCVRPTPPAQLSSPQRPSRVSPS